MDTQNILALSFIKTLYIRDIRLDRRRQIKINEMVRR